MKKRPFLLWAAFLLLLPSGVLHAQEIQTYPTLPCQGTCPEYTPAKMLTYSLPVYDADKQAESQESWVVISVTIGLDGSVKNPVVESVTGGKDFVKPVLEALNGRTYQPATENGKPVEENKILAFIFRFQGSARAHPAIASLYHDAMEKRDDPATAITLLRAISDRKEMNLYEATMIANALAQIEVKTGDYASAMRDIETATLGDGMFLDAKEKAPALRLRIVLDANAHQDADAFSSFDALKKLEDVPATDSVAPLIAKLHAEIDSQKPLWEAAQIRAEGQPVWTHTMLRRSFGFADIKGSLTRFHLRCETHGIESPVTDSATWTIPPSWTKCNILVEGTPGTTFKFGEAQPDTASAPAKPN